MCTQLRMWFFFLPYFGFDWLDFSSLLSICHQTKLFPRLHCVPKWLVVAFVSLKEIRERYLAFLSSYVLVPCCDIITFSLAYYNNDNGTHLKFILKKHSHLMAGNCFKLWTSLLPLKLCSWTPVAVWSFSCSG